MIDGTNNSTTTVAIGVGANFADIAVNPVTNKIYVAGAGSTNVTVIDGTNNSTTTVAVVQQNTSLTVNPVTNRIYVGSLSGQSITVITPVPTNAIPLNTTITPVANNTVFTPTPTFSLLATSNYSPIAPPPQNIYFQVDTLINPLLFATEQSRTATTLTANATTPTLQPGIHILYYFAGDGSEATSINPITNENYIDELLRPQEPNSSAIIGGIGAYVFLVADTVGEFKIVNKK